jgi:hypothetical protein
MGMRKVVLLLSAVAAAVLLASGVAFAVAPGAIQDANTLGSDPLDADYSNRASAAIPPPENGGQRMVQTFVAQNTGQLTDVRAVLQRNTPEYGPMTAQIIKLPTANSSSEVLAETTIQVTGYGSTAQNTPPRAAEASFSTPAHVEAGQSYGLAFANRPGVNAVIGINYGDTYPEGRLRSLWPDDTWNDFQGELAPGIDVLFSVYVVPDPKPTDTTPPKVTSTVPDAGATRVAPTVNVKATFSEDMMASTINKTTFTLRKQNTTGFVAATVTYDPSTDTATLDPTNSLRRGATYKASVNLGAQDQAGNPLDQNESLSGSQRKDWTFKVRP